MLAKTLETRHLNLIALGGSIGTGIFLTSGYAISIAGPGGAICAYLLIALMVFFLITSLGELSTYKPSTGTFCEYSRLYVNESFGYAMGVNYWFNWAITLATEISASVIIVKFWYPQASDFLLSAIFFFSLLGLNLFSVRIYGELEYIMSLLKIFVILIFIALGLFLVFKKPNFGFENFIISDGPFHNGLAGFFTVFLSVGFAFQGCELIGVTSGEARDPATSIPAAVKNVFWRLLLFYVLATLIISLLVPFNDPSLVNVNGSVHASPFTLVFEKFINHSLAASVLNLVILIAVLSAANASMYSATRMLWYMADTKQAPKLFKYTTNYGLPLNALLATALVGSTVFLTSFISNGVLFAKLLNISSSCGFIAWFGIALSHYYFRKRANVNPNKLIYKAIAFPFGPIFSMVLIMIIIFGQGYSLWSNFTIGNFLDAYGSLILFILLMFGYHSYKTRKLQN